MFLVVGIGVITIIVIIIIVIISFVCVRSIVFCSVSFLSAAGVGGMKRGAGTPTDVLEGSRGSRVGGSDSTAGGGSVNDGVVVLRPDPVLSALMPGCYNCVGNYTSYDAWWEWGSDWRERESAGHLRLRI